jgi:acetyltransferase-like isoleucine patch superfamily enzyme
MPVKKARTSVIAKSVVFLKGAHISISKNTTIMDYCVLGVENPDKDVFENEEQKKVSIGAQCIIYPWSMFYEGAVIEDAVKIGERCMIGSRTRIGRGARLLYCAQVHDKVVVGNYSIIGGFVADNCVIGEKCSIFGSLVHNYAHRNPRKWDETDEIGPTIEDEVVIGWGAVVVGPIKIGKGALIKPNSVVTRDVKPGVRYEGS